MKSIAYNLQSYMIILLYSYIIDEVPHLYKPIEHAGKN